jgi:uncharacterized protein (TIGR02117 family)
MWLLKRTFQLLFFFSDLLILYLLLAIIGLFWARSSNESINEVGIPLIVYGDGFHTELYLPVKDSILNFNWFDFIQDSTIIHKHRLSKYIAFGWANEDWSLASTRNETGVLLALKAVFWPWNRSIVHVQLVDSVHPLKHPFTEYRLLNLEQYQQLIDFIKGGFVLHGNKPIVKSYHGYYESDYFFSSNRRYNAFNTCNQWTADALNACNIRNPGFAPFGWSIAYQVKK